MNSHKITELFQIFECLNPDPKTELNYTNHYTLLVAVALSAQSTDRGVNKATQSLFQIIKTPQDMLNLGLEGLKSHIKTIGLYPTKAENILKAAALLVERYGGDVPGIREALESLPGVGRKTANVVLSIAFDQPTLAVDTHIFRVAHRLGLSTERTPLEVEHDLTTLIPEHFIDKAHHWLILHGRYICKARAPLCEQCPVQHLCAFKSM